MTVTTALLFLIVTVSSSSLVAAQLIDGGELGELGVASLISAYLIDSETNVNNTTITAYFNNETENNVTGFENGNLIVTEDETFNNQLGNFQNVINFTESSLQSGNLVNISENVVATSEPVNFPTTPNFQPSTLTFFNSNFNEKEFSSSNNTELGLSLATPREFENLSSITEKSATSYSVMNTMNDSISISNDIEGHVTAATSDINLTTYVPSFSDGSVPSFNNMGESGAMTKQLVTYLADSRRPNQSGVDGTNISVPANETINESINENSNISPLMTTINMSTETPNSDFYSDTNISSFSSDKLLLENETNLQIDPPHPVPEMYDATTQYMLNASAFDLANQFERGVTREETYLDAGSNLTTAETISNNVHTILENEAYAQGPNDDTTNIFEVDSILEMAPVTSVHNVTGDLIYIDSTNDTQDIHSEPGFVFNSTDSAASMRTSETNESKVVTVKSNGNNGTELETVTIVQHKAIESDTTNIPSLNSIVPAPLKNETNSTSVSDNVDVNTESTMTDISSSPTAATQDNVRFLLNDSYVISNKSFGLKDDFHDLVTQNEKWSTVNSTDDIFEISNSSNDTLSLQNASVSEDVVAKQTINDSETTLAYNISVFDTSIPGSTNKSEFHVVVPSVSEPVTPNRAFDDVINADIVNETSTFEESVTANLSEFNNVTMEIETIVKKTEPVAMTTTMNATSVETEMQRTISDSSNITEVEGNSTIDLVEDDPVMFDVNVTVSDKSADFGNTSDPKAANFTEDSNKTEVTINKTDITDFVEEIGSSITETEVNTTSGTNPPGDAHVLIPKGYQITDSPVLDNVATNNATAQPSSGIGLGLSVSDIDSNSETMAPPERNTISNQVGESLNLADANSTLVQPGSKWESRTPEQITVPMSVAPEETMSEMSRSSAVIEEKSSRTTTVQTAPRITTTTKQILTTTIQTPSSSTTTTTTTPTTTTSMVMPRKEEIGQLSSQCPVFDTRYEQNVLFITYQSGECEIKVTSVVAKMQFPRVAKLFGRRLKERIRRIQRPKVQFQASVKGSQDKNLRCQIYPIRGVGPFAFIDTVAGKCQILLSVRRTPLRALKQGAETPTGKNLRGFRWLPMYEFLNEALF